MRGVCRSGTAIRTSQYSAIRPPSDPRQADGPEPSSRARRRAFTTLGELPLVEIPQRRRRVDRVLRSAWRRYLESTVVAPRRQQRLIGRQRDGRQTVGDRDRKRPTSSAHRCWASADGSAVAEREQRASGAERLLREDRALVRRLRGSTPSLMVRSVSAVSRRRRETSVCNLMSRPSQGRS